MLQGDFNINKHMYMAQGVFNNNKYIWYRVI